MPIDVDRVQKPIRKLRKFLKKRPKRPTPDEIHNLRTNTRRFEAAIAAFGLDRNGNERRLLRDLKPIRKRAGKIRDMDVLTDYASDVHVDGEEECLVQLLEHLGASRDREVKKLRAEVTTRAPELRRRQKTSSKHIEKVLRDADHIEFGSNPPATREAMASALQLSSELVAPKRLDRKNLHPYRLKVKELRYVLQLASDADHQRFVDKLGQVKDAIGEWHDWEELIAIADSVLDHGANCKLTKKMRTISKEKYDRALKLATQMRSTYLAPRTSGNGAARVLSRPVLDAISAMAA
jgi:CHAD domain-containing protein